MFSTITIVTTTPFIFDIWDIEMLSDNRVHFRNGNKKITFGDTDKLCITIYIYIYIINIQYCSESPTDQWNWHLDDKINTHYFYK